MLSSRRTYHLGDLYKCSFCIYIILDLNIYILLYTWVASILLYYENDKSSIVSKILKTMQTLLMNHESRRQAALQLNFGETKMHQYKIPATYQKDQQLAGETGIAASNLLSISLVKKYCW